MYPWFLALISTKSRCVSWAIIDSCEFPRNWFVCNPSTYVFGNRHSRRNFSRIFTSRRHIESDQNRSKVPVWKEEDERIIVRHRKARETGHGSFVGPLGIFMFGLLVRRHYASSWKLFPFLYPPVEPHASRSGYPPSRRPIFVFISLIIFLTRAISN